MVPEGIEPSLGTHLVRTVYKAVGASNYTTGPKMVGGEGFEPPLKGFRFVCITTLSGLCLLHNISALGGNRQVSTPSFSGLARR